MRTKSIRASIIVFIVSVIVLYASGFLLSAKAEVTVQLIYSNDVAGYLEPCG
jgi:hypothetical protein